MCQAKIGGTAFPIALYADDVLVLKMKLSGKDCILNYNTIIKTRQSPRLMLMMKII